MREFSQFRDEDEYVFSAEWQVPHLRYMNAPARGTMLIVTVRLNVNVTLSMSSSGNVGKAEIFSSCSKRRKKISTSRRDGISLSD